MKKPQKGSHTAVCFFLRMNSIPEYGCGLVVSFGMGGWGGEADGCDTVGRYGHGDDGAFVERDALDRFRWIGKRGGYGQ